MEHKRKVDWKEIGIEDLENNNKWLNNIYIMIVLEEKCGAEK